MISTLFRRAFTALLAFSLLLPSTGFAAVTGSISDVMPGDVTTFTQADLTQFTPKSLIDSLVNLITQEVDSPSLKSSSDDAATAKKRTGLAVDVLTGGPFGLGMRLDASLGELQNYFVGTINDVQWTAYLDLDGKNLEKKTYGTHEYYLQKTENGDNALLSNEKKSLARVNQFFIGADSEKSIKMFFDTLDKGQVLSKNKNYQATAGSVGTGSLLSGYVDLGSALKEIKDEMESGKTAKQSIFDVANHMGYALAQFTGGVSMSTVVTRDSAPKDSLYIPSPFTPSLYQYSTAQHPLLYAEGSNLAQLVKQGESTTGTKISDELGTPEAIGFDFEKDFLNLFTKGYSLTVEKGNGTFLPSFTFMADMKGNEPAMTETLKKIYTELTTTKSPDGVVVSGSSLGGLYDFSVTFTPDDNFWNEFEGVFPRMSTMLTLTVNLTNDGVLVVSTKPNVMTSYKTGMDVTEFGDVAKRSDVSMLFSLNFNEITTIAKEAVQQYYTSLDEESKPYVDVTATLNAIDQIFSPWQRISASATSTDTSGSATVKFFFDPRIYESAYWEGVMKSAKVLDASSTKYERVTSKFNDVQPDQWYAHDVKNLKARGVVKGYYDNSFKPGQLVTRIEFLAMLYRGVYGDAPSSFSMEGDTSGGSDIAFSDVEPFEWYYDMLADSSKRGLVKGYADKSFKPGALISRSEAVAMIARFYEYNNDTEFFVDLPWRDDRSFGDVPENSWFGPAVHNAYKLGIVDGTGKGDKFEPGRNLNRAEAAKLISRLLRKKVG